MQAFCQAIQVKVLKLALCLLLNITFKTIVFKIHYLISGLLGHLLPAAPIFFLNRYWTFKSNVSIFKGLPIYIVICIITLSSHSLIQYISKEYFGVLEVYSQACGIFVSVIVSFILVRKLMKSKI